MNHPGHDPIRSGHPQAPGESDRHGPDWVSDRTSRRLGASQPVSSSRPRFRLIAHRLPSVRHRMSLQMSFPEAVMLLHR